MNKNIFNNLRPSLWKTRTSLFHIANIMAADDLETQRAKVLAAMKLT